MSSLLFVSNLLPRPDAPQRGLFNANLLRDVYRLLHAQGMRLRVLVPVAALPHERFDVTRWQYPGVPIADEIGYVPYLHIPYAGRNAASWFCRRALQKHADWFEQSDVVVGSWLYPDALAAEAIARHAGKRFVARLHGTDRFHLQAPLRGKACEAMLRRADRVLVNAVFMRDTLAGIADACVIPNGVDEGCFYVDARIEREPGVVLWVGNLVDIKDPGRAIRVFQASMKHGARKMFMVGAGPLRKKLERQVAANGLGDKVSFVGKMPPEQLGVWMRRVWCLLLTSVSEGMPNVIHEALACGTPVVSTHVGDVPSVVRNGANGYCVASNPAGDAELVEGMKQVLQREWDPQAVRDASHICGWEETARVFLENISVTGLQGDRVTGWQGCRVAG